MVINWKKTGRDINVEGARPVALVRELGGVFKVSRVAFPTPTTPVCLIGSAKLSMILQTKPGLEGRGPTATEKSF